MRSRYRCDICKCYLDPGEGLLCDECREKAREKIRKADIFSRLLRSDSEQVEMRLEEMV